MKQWIRFASVRCQLVRIQIRGKRRKERFRLLVYRETLFSLYVESSWDEMLNFKLSHRMIQRKFGKHIRTRLLLWQMQTHTSNMMTINRRLCPAQQTG
jgi:hypothetical protein